MELNPGMTQLYGHSWPEAAFSHRSYATTGWKSSQCFFDHLLRIDRPVKAWRPRLGTAWISPHVEVVVGTGL